MTAWKWSTTAGDNDDSDSTINWREGQAPSTVNNSTRALMAAIKKWWLDLGGAVNSAGSSTAITATSNQSITTLTDGARIALRITTANGAAPTLALDSTTAKNITIRPGIAPDAGMFPVGSVQEFSYDASDDEWRHVGNYVPAGVDVTGSMKDYLGATAPAGYVLASGRTIGNASSGGTERANADTEDLFELLWDAYSNSILAIQDSAGSGTTRGSTASDDFAANKRLPLPDFRGRVSVGQDDMGGTSANRITSAGSGVDGDTLGNSGGAETHTLTLDELPEIDIDNYKTDPGHTHNIENFRQNDLSVATGGSSVTRNTEVTKTSEVSTTGITFAAFGGGSAHNNMPPFWVVNKIIKL